MALCVIASAADWNTPEQQLARKIVAVTGPGTVLWTVENRSSLGRRDIDIITNGLRSALEGAGVRVVKAEQAAATIAITFSENPGAYVWVAQIQQAAGDSAVVMVSIPRSEGGFAAHDSVPMNLRKALLWKQEERILDVAVLEEGTTPTQIAVLDPERLSFYRWREGRWQAQQTFPLSHSRPWPRDVRGRLLPAKDHPLDAYLPGVRCQLGGGASLNVSCRETDDPWPLVPVSLSAAMSTSNVESRSALLTPLGGFFSPMRNFFTGAIAPGIGNFSTISKFYSAAFLPRDKYVLWLFAGVDGQTHMIDGMTDLAERLGWGSDIATVKTGCGAGWQVLATSAGNKDSDSVRAYELPDRNPVPVSAAVDFSGEITALWTEAKGDTAVVVTKNRETGNYEAFRLAMACN